MVFGRNKRCRPLLGNESVLEDCFQATMKMMVRGRGGWNTNSVASSHIDDDIDGDGNGDSESL